MQGPQSEDTIKQVATSHSFTEQQCKALVKMQQSMQARCWRVSSFASRDLSGHMILEFADEQKHQVHITVELDSADAPAAAGAQSSDSEAAERDSPKECEPITPLRLSSSSLCSCMLWVAARCSHQLG
jgi:hypothetical protein